MEDETDSFRAARIHEQYFQALMAGHSTVVEFGKEAVKTIALINGGSAVAVLAFLGQVSSADKGEALARVLAPRLTSSLTCFAIGVAVAGAASLLSYGSQTLYQIGARRIDVRDAPPFLLRTKWSKIWFGCGVVAQCLAIVAACSSYVYFCYGLWRAAAAFRIAFPGP